MTGICDDVVCRGGTADDSVSVGMSAMGGGLMIGSLPLSVGSRADLGRPRRCQRPSPVVATILLRTIFF